MGTPQREHFPWGKWENCNTEYGLVKTSQICDNMGPWASRTGKGTPDAEIYCWIYFRRTWKLWNIFLFSPGHEGLLQSLWKSLDHSGFILSWTSTSNNLSTVSNSIWIKYIPSSSFVSLHLSVILLKFSKFLCAQLLGEYVTEPRSCRLYFLF